MKKTLICIFLIISTYNLIGQNFSNQILIHSIYSNNNQFFLQSIPFDNELESTYGISYLYSNSNSQPIYNINRYFELSSNNDILISDDGEIIIYTTDNQFNSSKTLLYKNGNLYKKANEKFILNNDTIKIISLNANKIILESNNKKIAFVDEKSINIISKQINLPSDNLLFTSNDQNKINKLICEKYKLKEIKDYQKEFKKFETYTIFIDALIDSSGKITIIDTKASNFFNVDSIKTLISSINFEYIKRENIQTWRVKGFFSFKKKTIQCVKKQTKNEYCKNPPINIEDCFNILDTLLTESTKNFIKNSNDDMFFMFEISGLLIYMQYHWDLYEKSCLTNYFNYYNIYNPKVMSSIILSNYYYWLTQNNKWKKWYLN